METFRELNLILALAESRTTVLVLAEKPMVELNKVGELWQILFNGGEFKKKGKFFWQKNGKTKFFFGLRSVKESKLLGT